MSSSISGMCTNCVFDPEAKMVRFTLQDTLGKYITSDYYYLNENFPLKKGDMVYALGEFIIKIIGGEYHNIFECSSLTVRYEFDLLNFLITYMPYIKQNIDKDNIETVTQYYRDITERIYDYCRENVGDSSVDSICKLFNSLYRCISIDDSESLINFATKCFKNPNLKKIKNFFVVWNNDVLVRPLELLGLSIEEIKSIHIPLYEAYKIIKKNPYRLPQIPIEKSIKIALSHLNLQQPPMDYITNHLDLEYNSTVAILCGNISRMVYDNFLKKKWSSTPVARILEKFPCYEEYKSVIETYYYCIQEFDHLYFQKPYNIEKVVSNKIAVLTKKSEVIIQDPAYPGIIPSEKQDEAIKGALKNHISLIHGGPGTGKTSILSEIIRSSSAMGKNTLCTALTGAATTRIRDTTMEAGVFDLTTIMTMCMAITMQSKLVSLKISYVIVDEVSMINTALISEFISAFRTLDFQFIFIGDSDQLEPIEWGNFMKQILKTPIKKYHLTENFRSEKTIVQICQDVIDPLRIHEHRAPIWNKVGPDYCFNEGNIMFLEQKIANYAYSFQANLDLSREANIELFGQYRNKFTIISPYRKTCDIVNGIFQKYFMTPIVSEHTDIGGTRFYLGDRVMKLINDYGINVMNGEQGRIIKVMPNYIVCIFRNKTETITPYVEKSKFSAMKQFVKKNNIKFNPYNKGKDNERIVKTSTEIKSEIDRMRIQFGIINESVTKDEISNDTKSDCEYVTLSEQHKNDQNEIIRLYFSLLEEYPLALYNINEEAEFLNIKNLCLAYCITTHKGQGSQYDYVIYFLDGKINSFITVNNIYTGISRAKKHLDIVTESICLINAACLNKQRFVYDKLSERINSKLPKEMVEEMVTKNSSIELDELSIDVVEDPDMGDCELDEDYDLGY